MIKVMSKGSWNMLVITLQLWFTFLRARMTWNLQNVNIPSTTTFVIFLLPAFCSLRDIKVVAEVCTAYFFIII